MVIVVRHLGGDMNCRICKAKFEKWGSLAKHVRSAHKTLPKDYYDQYVWKKRDQRFCPTCGDETSWRGDGYLKYCSAACHANSPKSRDERKQCQLGRKHSPEHIAKRIANTDQAAKWKAQQKTFRKKYGVDNPAKNANVRVKIGNTLRGRKLPPRTKSHSRRIKEARADNGTSYIFSTSYYRGIFCRSSYERQFLQWCWKHKVRVRVAERSEFRVRYKRPAIADKKSEYYTKVEYGKTGYAYYYPDFYLPDLDTIVEVKPKVLCAHPVNKAKFRAARRVHNFEVVTEHDLMDSERLVSRFKP